MRELHDGLPTWTETKRLLLRSKPALRCTVYGLGKPHPAVVRHDGDGTWLVEDGQAKSESTLSWALSAAEPARFARLAHADGTVVSRVEELARPCLVVRVEGLRRPDGPAFVLTVDAATGVIVRMERDADPAPIIVMTELEIGTPSP